MTPEQFTELMAHVKLISFSAFLMYAYYLHKLTEGLSWFSQLGVMVMLAIGCNIVLLIYGG